LSDTAVTDAGLRHVARLGALKWLRLEGTAVTDRGLLALVPCTALQSVVAGETAVTEAGVDALRRALPRVRVGLGPRNDVAPEP